MQSKISTTLVAGDFNINKHQCSRPARPPRPVKCKATGKIYKSVTEAADTAGVSKSKMCRAILLDQELKGQLFEYAD